MTKRICLVGAGSWAVSMHLPALSLLGKEKRAELVAVCDLDAARARATAEDLSAEPYTDMDRMIEEKAPDGLVLLVHPKAMPEVIRKAVSRGIPFLSEKPPATDSRIHGELITLVGDLPHVVGYNRRHAPYVQRAIGFMAGATIQSVTALFSRHRRKDEDFSATAVHCIDTARFLSGSDIAQARIEASPAAGVTNFFLNGWTVAGCRVEMMITPNTGSAQEHYIIRGEEKSATIAFPQSGMLDLPGWVELHENNRVVERLGPAGFDLAEDDVPGLSGITGEHESFLDVLNLETTSVSTLETSLQTQVLREALIKLQSLGGRQSAEYAL